MKRIYIFCQQHKVLFWGVVLVVTGMLAWLSSRCRFEENIFQLLPETGNEAYRVTFTNLKLKDKIFVQAVAADSTAEVPAEELAEALDLFVDSVVRASEERQMIEHTLSSIDPMLLIDAADYAAAHFPAYLEIDSAALDSLCSTDHIRTQLALYQDFLDTDLGENFYDVIAYDPCGIVYNRFGALLPTDGETDRPSRFKNNHLYSTDGQVCYGFLTPSFGTDNSREASRLIDIMDDAREYIRTLHPSVDILYHGTVVLSGGNSKRMHSDILFTVGGAMLLILFLLFFCLKRPSYLALTVCALGFGMLLALGGLYLAQGGMSMMSLGIGAIVLGVAFSYVLHILIHYIYTGDVDLTLREQTRPVLLGSLTTIGAFAGILFTESKLLNDFGFFALLVIAGTTLFSLLVIPHLLPKRYTPNRRAFQILERVNAYRIERNKPICVIMALWVILCLCFSGRYSFDSDLKNIGYTSADCARAQASWAAHVNENLDKQYFAAVAPSVDEALEALPAIEHTLDSLRKAGMVENGPNISSLLPSLRVQNERLLAWERYFTPEKQKEVWHAICAACQSEGIDADMFMPFKQLMESPAEAELLTEAGILPPEVLENLTEQAGEKVLVYFPVKATAEQMPTVKDCLAQQEGCMLMDPYYYTTGLVELIHNDFNLIMLISSVFVFLLLLVTYRNLWLTLIALCPMVLSWYTVLGAMALFGQPFNLVNIVVSSFVFGIGVDYSIFILEGLLKGDSSNPTMVYNKTAITLSATILVICMFILGFAQHPAIRSISFASVVGMVTTILLSYTLEPNLYRLYQRIKHRQKK